MKSTNKYYLLLLNAPPAPRSNAAAPTNTNVETPPVLGKLSFSASEFLSPSLPLLVLSIGLLSVPLLLSLLLVLLSPLLPPLPVLLSVSVPFPVPLLLSVPLSVSVLLLSFFSSSQIRLFLTLLMPY